MHRYAPAFAHLEFTVGDDGTPYEKVLDEAFRKQNMNYLQQTPGRVVRYLERVVASGALREAYDQLPKNAQGDVDAEAFGERIKVSVVHACVASVAYANAARDSGVVATQELFDGTITNSQIAALLEGVDKDRSSSVSARELFSAVNRRTRADVLSMGETTTGASYRPAQQAPIGASHDNNHHQTVSVGGMGRGEQDLIRFASRACPRVCMTHGPNGGRVVRFISQPRCHQLRHEEPVIDEGCAESLSVHRHG